MKNIGIVFLLLIFQHGLIIIIATCLNPQAPKLSPFTPELRTGFRRNTQPVSRYSILITRSLLSLQPLSKSSSTSFAKPITKTSSSSSSSSSVVPSTLHPHHSHKHASKSKSKSKSPSPTPTHSPSHVSPPRFPLSPSPSPSATYVAHPSPSPTSPQLPVSSTVLNKSPHNSDSKPHTPIIWAALAGSFAFLIILALAAFICHKRTLVSVKPWAPGLSGQLQRAFVSGVPKLKRPELEIACEDFSNIIGSLLDATVYKGILSSGVEIAVVASSVKSPEEWSKTLELQFRNKIETLSKVNHKNFVNLIGYCEEEKPFTRMMVFEYAPNGTLFEHLHIKEAERLDWRMRLRILMGMAYSLEHMHHLEPPISHRDMQSCSIYLSEDYAAKISDFSFWNNGSRSKMRSPSMQLLEASSTDIESNVFNFGVVLFEMITGRVPYMGDDCSVADWVLELLEWDQFPREIIDPTLSSYQEEQVQRLFHIVRDCINSDVGGRPCMRDVAAQLKDITGISPQEATPKLSPLWWAELEILSSGANERRSYQKG